MSFRVYDYKCCECGVVEERFVRAAEADNQWCLHHKAYIEMKRLPSAPHLDYLGMGNDPDMPSAYEKKGDMITKRHKDAGQANTQ